VFLRKEAHLADLRWPEKRGGALVGSVEDCEKKPRQSCQAENQGGDEHVTAEGQQDSRDRRNDVSSGSRRDRALERQNPDWSSGKSAAPAVGMVLWHSIRWTATVDRVRRRQQPQVKFADWDGSSWTITTLTAGGAHDIAYDSLVGRA